MKKYNDFITENNDNIVDAQIVDDNNDNKPEDGGDGA